MEKKTEYKKKKNTQGHILFGSALKWSFHGIGCSRSDDQSTADQPQGKPKGSPLQEQEGRYTAFLDPLAPRFYTDTQRGQSGSSDQLQ